jgi:hypothetical protein
VPEPELEQPVLLVLPELLLELLVLAQDRPLA